jgi:hypothetical protein
MSGAGLGLIHGVKRLCKKGSDGRETVEHETERGDVDQRLRDLQLILVILAEVTVTAEPGGLRSMVQVSPVILNARWPRLMMTTPTLVPLERASKLAALLARIGHHGADRGEERAQTTEQARARALVGDSRRLDPARDDQSQRVYQDMALATLDQFVAVEAAHAAVPGSSGGPCSRAGTRAAAGATGSPCAAGRG